MNIRKTVILTISLLLLMCLLGGCKQFSDPPNLNSVKRRFENNYDDIMTVVNYMIDSGYEDIYISDTDRKMFVEFEYLDIEDKEVLSAIDVLIGEGEYLSIDKHGDTIEFRQSHNFFDVACGVAYLTNDSAKLEIEFLTEYELLSESNWYYYVADYNEWRVENNKS